LARFACHMGPEPCGLPQRPQWRCSSRIAQAPPDGPREAHKSRAL